MIKAHRFNNYDYVFICDKDSIKNWLTEKGWTELHETTEKRGGDHVKMEDIFSNIDKCEAVALYTKNVHDNHRLTLMMGNGYINYYNVLTVTPEEIDEYIIEKPYCVRCRTIRQKGGGQTGCTPNWDDTHDMEWNLTNKKNEPYHESHDWNREYEEYE